MSKKKKKILETNIINVTALEEASDSMKRYGQSLIEDRAIPDYRDGCLAIYRKIIWAMYKQGNGYSLVKSARVIGDVIGKYSPHGDTGAYGGVVTLVNSAVPPLLKQGNWGTIEEPKSFAAYRYTETGLSKFGQSFTHPDTMKNLVLIPNFDGSTEEPLYLKATLPNLLLNGSFAIGVGVTCSIPPLKPTSLLKLIKKALNGKKITINDCDTLEFNYNSGGVIFKDPDDEFITDRLKSYWETGQGPILMESNYELDIKNRSLTVTGFAPHLKIPKLLVQISQDPTVASYEDFSDLEIDVHYVFHLKKSVHKDDVEDVLYDLASYFDSTMKMSTVVITRYLDKDGNPKATYKRTNISNLITMWADYRKELSIEMLDYQIDKNNAEMKRLNLLILAANSLDIIIKSLKVDDSETYLIKHMKITREEADYIMSMKVSQLKKFNIDSSKTRIKVLTDLNKSNKSNKKNVTKYTYDTLKSDFKNLILQ